MISATAADDAPPLILRHFAAIQPALQTLRRYATISTPAAIAAAASHYFRQAFAIAPLRIATGRRFIDAPRLCAISHFS
jgi:hypothetical protein